MSSRFLLFGLALGSLYLPSQSAPAEEYPKSMLAFLKPGMFVATPSRVEEMDRTIIIFESEQHSQMVRDATRMEVADLRQKYDEIDRQARAAFDDYVAGLRTKLKDGAETSVLGEPRLQFRGIGLHGSAPLYHKKIIHVGDDYILLETSWGTREAIPTKQINKLEWASPNLIRAYSPEKRTETELRIAS